AATRYHSLAVLQGTVPADLQVTATTENGIIMGLAHRSLPLHGVQFHPESVLTEGGHRLLANWLARTGDDGAVARSAGMVPLVAEQPAGGVQPGGLNTGFSVLGRCHRPQAIDQRARVRAVSVEQAAQQPVPGIGLTVAIGSGGAAITATTVIATAIAATVAA